MRKFIWRTDVFSLLPSPFSLLPSPFHAIVLKAVSLRAKFGVLLVAGLVAALPAIADNWKASSNASQISGAIVPNVNTTKFGIGITTAPTYQTELRGPPSGNLFQALKLSTAGSSHVTLSASPSGSSNFFVINSNGGSNGFIFSTGSPDGNGGLGTEAMRITTNVYGPTLLIGQGTAATAESNFALAARLNNSQEGGQLQLNAPTGGGRTLFLDNYQASPTASLLRFLSGTDGGSNTWLASMDLTTGDFGTVGQLVGSSISTTGQLTAGSIKVNNWTITAPDYAFEPDYKIRSLEETERFVKKNRHLPEIPSASQMKKDGLNLADMNLLLLKKVEELTLIAIEQEKRIKKLEKVTRNR